jgi:hypothetical protein
MIIGNRDEIGRDPHSMVVTQAISNLRAGAGYQPKMSLGPHPGAAFFWRGMRSTHGCLSCRILLALCAAAYRRAPVALAYSLVSCPCQMALKRGICLEADGEAVFPSASAPTETNN